MWLMVTKLYVWHEKHLGHVQSNYLKDITHKQMHPKEFYFFISVLLLAFLTVSKSHTNRKHIYNNCIHQANVVKSLV